jgi:hypothetical protein
MKLYSLTQEDMTRHANLASNVMAETMLEAGVIDKETHRIITEDFAVIANERNFFGKCIAKALGRKEDDSGSVFYNCVQVQNIKYNKKDKIDVHQPEDSDREGVDNGN